MVTWPDAALPRGLTHGPDSVVSGSRGERGAPPQAASASLPFRRCLSPTRPVFSGEARNWEKNFPSLPIVSVLPPTLNLIQKSSRSCLRQLGAGATRCHRCRQCPDVPLAAQPNAHTTWSLYFFKDERGHKKMSKIKTLTLLPSAVAREGSWPPRLQGCAQGPCRAARRVTAHVSWGELAAAPSPCPLAFPGNRGEETEAKGRPSPCAAPPRPLGATAALCNATTRPRPSGEARTRGDTGTGRSRAGHGGTAQRPHTAPLPAREPSGFPQHLSVPIGRWQRCQGL